MAFYDLPRVQCGGTVLVLIIFIFYSLLFLNLINYTQGRTLRCAKCSMELDLFKVWTSIYFYSLVVLLNTTSIKKKIMRTLIPPCFFSYSLSLFWYSHDTLHHHHFSIGLPFSSSPIRFPTRLPHSLNTDSIETCIYL